MEVDACLPVITNLLYHTPILRNDVLARYEPHAVIAAQSVTVLHDVAQLNERVPPVYGIKGKTAQLLEPRLVEVMQCLVALVPVCVHEFERLSHDEAFTLADTARKVAVSVRVAIDVVQPLTVGVIYVDGHLPRPAPICNILSRQGVGGPLQCHDHMLHTLAVIFLGKVETAIGSVKDVRIRASCQTAEKSLYIHYQLCLKGFCE